MTARPRNPMVLFFLVLAVAAGATATPCSAELKITVSAAASLGDVLHAIEEAFENKYPGMDIQLNLGSSGALRHQIEHGAPVDVFLSAAESPMQALVGKGLVSGHAVRVFATNHLVLVRSAHAPPALQSWDDLLHDDVQRIAIGNPEHVPAGQYSRAVLEALGLWEPLQDKLVFGEDVRQVLAYVESGGADAGLVYITDVAGRSHVDMVAQAPPGSHASIVYLAAIVSASRAPEAGRAFIDYLVSEEGQGILRRYGFLGPEE